MLSPAGNPSDPKRESVIRDRNVSQFVDYSADPFCKTSRNSAGEKTGIGDFL